MTNYTPLSAAFYNFKNHAKRIFNKKAFHISLVSISLAFLPACSCANASNNDLTNNSSAAQKILANAPELNPDVLKLSLKAYKHARKMGLDQQGILTIIDYSLPSAKRRLWVINVNSGKVKYHTLVAHGKGSGLTYATNFSNKPNSDASSIGVYLTDKTYSGKHGYSLRLKGLEKGFNDAIYKRAVVMHSAWYVNSNFANQNGRIGRSWGCPALDKKVASKVIDEIKDGSLIFAYYPDNNWLQNSSYLQA